MRECNEWLENGGLIFESPTHEWFSDTTSTDYARKVGLDVYCFYVRNKSTGEYDLVMMDVKANPVIYVTKSLEAMVFEIDKLKAIKRFNDNEG